MAKKGALLAALNTQTDGFHTLFVINVLTAEELRHGGTKMLCKMDNVANLLAQLGYQYHLSAVNVEGVTTFQVWKEVAYKVGTNPELRLKFVCEDQDAATALTIALQQYYTPHIDARTKPNMEHTAGH